MSTAYCILLLFFLKLYFFCFFHFSGLTTLKNVEKTSFEYGIAKCLKNQKNSIFRVWEQQGLLFEAAFWVEPVGETQNKERQKVYLLLESRTLLFAASG